MTFEAEKRYYHAAQEVQIVPLTRFLNYQSSKRNKFANEIAEALTFNDIKPVMSYIDKAKSKLLGLDIKRSLENTKYIPIMTKCLDFDQDIIDTSALLLKDRSLPVDIAEVLTRQMTFLIFQWIEGTDIIEELNSDRQVNHKKTKIITLKNYIM
ncbi:hypothetical protein GCM10022258_12720 [Aquimarina gracilis]